MSKICSCIECVKDIEEPYVERDNYGFFICFQGEGLTEHYKTKEEALKAFKDLCFPENMNNLTELNRARIEIDKIVDSCDNVRKYDLLDEQIIELGKYIKNLQNQLRDSWGREGRPSCRHEMGG